MTGKNIYEGNTTLNYTNRHKKINMSENMKHDLPTSTGG